HSMKIDMSLPGTITPRWLDMAFCQFVGGVQRAVDTASGSEKLDFWSREVALCRRNLRRNLQ
ncbi:Hypothetical protein FKW44_005822, partial [Caligus rogercresseyi]